MKTYGVIGLGHFGYHVAVGIAEQGLSILVADESMEKVKNISNIIENAYAMDSTDKNALKDAGFFELDIVVVSMGDSIEASILTVMALKDLGNKTIIAKANNFIHGEVLSKIGANKVVYPEKETAKRVVSNIVPKVIFEIIDISNSFKGARFEVPSILHNKTVHEIELFLDSCKVAAYKTNGLWQETIDKNYKIQTGDIVLIFGGKNHIEKVYEKVLR